MKFWSTVGTSVLAVALAAGGVVGLSGCDDSISTTRSAALNLPLGDRFTFSKVSAGNTETRRVQVQNSGSGQLIIAKVNLEEMRARDEFRLRVGDSDDQAAFEDAVAYDFGAGSDQLRYPIRLNPGESIYLFLDYRPAGDDSPGGARGKVTLTTNLSSNAKVDLGISVQQTGAEINVSPPSLNFDRVRAGEVVTDRVVVSNVGQADLFFEQMQLNGSQDYTPLINGRDPRRQPAVLEDPDGDGRPGLAPDGFFEIEVRYAPLAEGADSAELVITSNAINAPILAVELRANSETPCIRTNPPSVEFPTSLVNRTDSRSLAIESCGGEPVEITNIFIAPGSDPAFALDTASVPELPAILPALVDNIPPDPRFIKVAFSPREQRVYNGTLIIESNDPLNPQRAVPLLGRGVLNACPQARATQTEYFVVPLDVVTLDGSPSIDQDGPDNKPVEYEWVVVDRPDGSTSQPVESFFANDAPADGGRRDDPSTPTARFFVDLAGTYVIELRVRDNLGLDSVACGNPERVVIVAKPDRAFHIQLVWDTPADPDQTDTIGTDLDLHLLHPNAQNWFTVPYDCHYANPEPDWGVLDDPRDDPTLDIDDINGAGPENINLDEPEDTDLLGAPYLVGVHYYLSMDRVTQEDFGSSFATVRVFLNGELSWDFTDGDNPGRREMEAADHFWDVAQITWNSATRTGVVTTRDRYYTQSPRP